VCVPLGKGARYRLSHPCAGVAVTFGRNRGQRQEEHGHGRACAGEIFSARSRSHIKRLRATMPTSEAALCDCMSPNR
jgi:hypothetical protein